MKDTKKQDVVWITYGPVSSDFARDYIKNILNRPAYRLTKPDASMFGEPKENDNPGMSIQPTHYNYLLALLKDTLKYINKDTDEAKQIALRIELVLEANKTTKD